MKNPGPPQLRALIALGALLAFLNLSPGPAHAQLGPEDRKCVNSIHRGLVKVAQAPDGDIATCVRNAGKDRLEGQTPTA